MISQNAFRSLVQCGLRNKKDPAKGRRISKFRAAPCGTKAHPNLRHGEAGQPGLDSQTSQMLIWPLARITKLPKVR